MIERCQNSMNSMINLALCQFQTKNDKQLNLRKANIFIQMSKNKEANIVALPEMFNCPYDGLSFEKFAELEGEETFKFLEEMSKDIILIGGSIPEKDKNGFCYNTSYIFENGRLIGKHRKIHLFDIDFNNIKMHESNYLKPGQKTTVVDTSLGTIGVAICFDIRFSELFLEMNKKEPFLYVIPSIFNKVTGPAHLNAAEGVKSTEENLKIAVKGETFEFKEMYPPFLAEAKKEGNKKAILSFSYAMAAEKVHADLFQEVLIDLNKDDNTDFYLCTVCGYIHKNVIPDVCPICSSAGSKFIKTD